MPKHTPIPSTPSFHQPWNDMLDIVEQYFGLPRIKEEKRVKEVLSQITQHMNEYVVCVNSHFGTKEQAEGQFHDAQNTIRKLEAQRLETSDLQLKEILKDCRTKIENQDHKSDTTNVFKAADLAWNRYIKKLESSPKKPIDSIKIALVEYHRAVMTSGASPEKKTQELADAKKLIRDLADWTPDQQTQMIACLEPTLKRKQPASTPASTRAPKTQRARKNPSPTSALDDLWENPAVTAGFRTSIERILTAAAQVSTTAP